MRSMFYINLLASSSKSMVPSVVRANLNDNLNSKEPEVIDDIHSKLQLV